MDALTGYQERRLELADMIRAVLPIVHAYRDAPREQDIRMLLTRLASGRFQLAVIGQFSRGKTTLMNALLGEAYLPMGALPMTSVVTTVRYGTRPLAIVHSRTGGLPVQMPVAEAARFVAQASADRTRMRVASVEMEIPAELLRLGFEFVDTPGVGSAVIANTATTLRYLPQADAVMFVTGFDSVLTRAEADFLTTAAEATGKLFLIINKRDLVTDSEAAEITSYVLRWARDNLPAVPPVFETSALQALNGAIRRDQEQLSVSGIGPLRDALTRFLTAEQGRTALRNVATAAAGLITRHQRDLRVGQLTDQGAMPREAVLSAFDARMTELHEAVSLVAGRIVSTADAAVSAALTDHGSAWQAELGELLAPAAAPTLDAPATAESDPASDALKTLRLAGRQVGGDWLDRRAAELGEAALGATAEDIGDLLDLARSPRELGASIAGLPVLSAGPSGWLAEEVPELTAHDVELVVPYEPAKTRRHRSRGTSADDLQRLISDASEAAIADFVTRSAAMFRHVATAWARRLGEQAMRQVNVEAAQFRRYLTAQAREEDLAVLADIADRLDGFQESLAAWAPDGSDRPSPEAEPHAAQRDGLSAACEICGRMARVLNEYLIRRQFSLATSELDQTRHAENGGFCSLHTWQYVHMASPVGISAGQAKLANTLADALRDAEANGRVASELARHVALITQALTCGACIMLAQAEDEAAEEISGEAQPDSPPLLCLRHLAMVLEICPSLPASQAMIRTLATALQRASENMRAFALKREALRRSLITSDEASAYFFALQLLAGQRTLARTVALE